MPKLVLQNARLFSPRTLRLSKSIYRVTCREGKIAEIEELGGKKKLPVLGSDFHDLNGAVLMPAFADGHTHFADYSLRLDQIDLRGAENLEQVQAILRRESGRFGVTEWIRGSGWHKGNLEKVLTRQALDEAIGSRPAALFSYCNHALWVNSAALRIAGIDLHTKASDGGEIERDEEGNPTGVLKENATRLVTDIFPRPSVETIQRSAMKGIAQMHAYGIVSTFSHAIGLMEAEGIKEYLAYKGIRESGNLKFRIRVGFRFEDLAFAVQYRGDSDDFLSVWGIKFISDGSLGQQTALMFEPYEDTDNLGNERIAAKILEEQVCEAAKNGLPSAIHAIGDRANHNAVLAIEASRAINPNLRSRIEHAQILRQQEIQQMAELGILASVQPCHIPDDINTADKHLGERRSYYTHHTGGLLKAGVRLVFGSDAPIETPNPMKSLFSAVARRRLNNNGIPQGDNWHPDQRITLEEAVRAFTFVSAYAAGRERVEGDVCRGYLADLVAFRPDFFDMPADELLTTKPVLTVFNGETVYKEE